MRVDFRDKDHKELLQEPQLQRHGGMVNKEKALDGVERALEKLNSNRLLLKKVLQVHHQQVVLSPSQVPLLALIKRKGSHL